MSTQSTLVQDHDGWEIVNPNLSASSHTSGDFLMVSLLICFICGTAFAQPRLAEFYFLQRIRDNKSHGRTGTLKLNCIL